MKRGRILVIDDEKNIRHLFKNELSSEGYTVVTAKSGEEGLSIIADQNFEIIFLDIRLPKMSGIDVLRSLKLKSSQSEIIMITGYGDIGTAVESMKLGARDYITKPFKLVEILALVEQILDENRINKDLFSQQMEGRQLAVDPDFVGCPSPAMCTVYDMVERVGPADVTVLIQGETGVGKDVVARLIHSWSPRKNKPFVVVDCGLLNQNLAESELYGHGKGAFSGASEMKLGLVEKSHQGTIFFDEIGNLEPDMQKKFLRFLETKKFRRVGETKEREVDTRTILATNLDLKDAAHRGVLRTDLFYRMDVITIYVPPLRERKEDIPLLASHFAKNRAPGNKPRKISREALAALTNYAWPGNIRELRSVITKATLFSKLDEINLNDLPEHIVANQRTKVSTLESLEDLEKDHIIRILQQTGGNQSSAAQILGINRKTLYKKIHKYGLF
ncbi:MAG: sigma-54-dependent transcriptional regulator [Desulfomonilaceae bacterium]